MSLETSVHDNHHHNERAVDSVRIRVDVLGATRVQAGKMALGSHELGAKKPRHLLLALLLHRGAPVSKDRLVSLLWGGSAPHHAEATLVTYICVLRKTLRPCPAAQSLITTVAGGYAIDMSSVDLDLARYEQLIATGLQPDMSAIDALPILQQAMTLAGSPLLPEEAGSPWLEEVRRTHNQDVHKALIAAAEKVAGLPCRSAERWARLALERDPLDESAWRALLRNLETNGQYEDGLSAYDQCRSVFAAQLGRAPGPGLHVLYVRLLRASEDDEELNQLLDAVVRLHRARRSGVQPSSRDWGNGSDAIGHACSIEQASNALSQLLGGVRGTASAPLELW